MDTIFLELNFNRLVIAIRVRPVGYHNAYVIVNDEYKVIRDHLKKDCFTSVSRDVLDDLFDGIYEWRSEMRDNFEAAYTHLK